MQNPIRYFHIGVNYSSYIRKIKKNPKIQLTNSGRET